MTQEPLQPQSFPQQQAFVEDSISLPDIFLILAQHLKLIIVTPGIRPVNYNKKDDQKRFMSPKEAIKLGANYLVIGRPITQSSNPLLEITSINSSIE